MKIKLLNILCIGTMVMPLSVVTACTFTTGTSTVTIDLDGGKLNGKEDKYTIEVSNGTKFSDLGIPTKDNYQFKSWEKDGVIVNQYETITSDIAIKATYTLTNCYVYLNLNGGTLPGETEEVVQKYLKVGEKTYKDLGTPTKNHFQFDGWVDAKGKKVNPDDQIQESIGLKATWLALDPTKCYLTIELHGGSLLDSDDSNEKIEIEVAKNTKYGDLDVPSKPNYKFTGWQKDGQPLNNTDLIQTDFETIEALYTINAQPITKSLTVTFDLNGGKMGGLTDANTRLVANGVTYSSLGIPTKKDCYFIGWTDSQGVTVNPTDKINSSVTIKAKWETLSTIKKEAKYKYIGNDSQGYVAYQDSKYKQDVYLFNGSQIPYITIDDLFYTAFGMMKTRYEISHATGSPIYTVTNHFTSPNEKVTCEFDTDNQTITFSDYDKMIYYDGPVKENPLASGASYGNEYCLHLENQYSSSTPLVIKLLDYNLPIYSYTDSSSSEEHAYVPYYFAYNLFNCDMAVKVGLFIKNLSTNKYMFVRNNFYEIYDKNGKTPKSGYDQPDAYVINNLLVKQEENIDLDKSVKIFNLEYREFCYNLLALTLDIRYGMEARASRSEQGNYINYFNGCAYTKMEEYHDQLVSDQDNEANRATIEIVNKLFDDGGHTLYRGCNDNTTEPWDLSANIGNEIKYTNNMMKLLGVARKDAGHDLPSKPNGEPYDSYIEILSSLNKKNDIAWVTFDEFISSSCSYNQINAYNYMLNGTIGMTMRLQQIVNKQDSTIDKIVIDLSNNGGGIVYAEHFLASYLCGRDNTHLQKPGYLHGGVTHTICNPKTKAFSQYTYYGDINGDKQYDQKDYLPSNVQVYCIVSDASFSCGNMLPCHLADCSNCKFIGTRSGGGACYVRNSFDLGLGNIICSLSGPFHSLRINSTANNFITNDSGVMADFYPINSSLSYLADFYNRDEIIRRISLF